MHRGMAEAGIARRFGDGGAAEAAVLPSRLDALVARVRQLTEAR
jgi:hypothetical protein